VAEHLRNQDKPAARLDIEHLRKIGELVKLPLVLHGGSGISRKNILQAVDNGIAKINIGNAIRLAYERGGGSDGQVEKGQEACYEKVRELLGQFGSADESNAAKGAPA
jgi:fructose/tagatose bisphosphate aldolase